ncbi:MAG: nitrate/nitrite transport system permease protein [Akkermansiaceae bacterium]|jgi:nitrate/nitrite transport system permease protein
MKFFTKIKYPILKAIDVSGLTFLSPVVRLCYGEEPRVQMKKISQWIVIPICAVILFTIVWAYGSTVVKTKSGSVPGPLATLKASESITNFGDYEKAKEEAYSLTGPERAEALKTAKARLGKMDPIVQGATEKVAEAKASHSAKLKKRTSRMLSTRTTLKETYTATQTARKTALADLSNTLTPGNKPDYANFMKQVKQHTDKTDLEREELVKLAKEIKVITDEKSDEVAAALFAQTRAAEEKQFLQKQIDQLTGQNKATKIETAKSEIAEDSATLLTLTGPPALETAEKIAKAQSRLVKTEDSVYAGPKTLGYQIKRSILCVFTGFLIGSIIAIPIGILCGLNTTFMAAMTPFIAIFKPVSPIVWLPICLIIASAVIPAPDDSGFMKWLWEDAWILHHYDINPAFIASAITVALCSLWATLANTALGVASIDKDHLNVARVLKLGFWPRLFKIVIPSALPLIFAGLRISLGVGWMVLIAAELLSSSEGIGKFVWDQFNNGASDSFAKLFVVVFVVGIIGLLLDRIMIVFQRLVSFEGSPTAI